MSRNRLMRTRSGQGSKKFFPAMAIKMDDLYTVVEDLDKIQKYMHDVMGIGNMIDLNQFVFK